MVPTSLHKQTKYFLSSIRDLNSIPAEFESSSRSPCYTTPRTSSSSPFSMLKQFILCALLKGWLASLRLCFSPRLAPALGLGPSPSPLSVCPPPPLLSVSSGRESPHGAKTKSKTYESFIFSRCSLHDWVCKLRFWVSEKSQYKDCAYQNPTHECTFLCASATLHSAERESVSRPL